MSEVFKGYERQYCELSANLSRKCASAGLLPVGGILDSGLSLIFYCSLISLDVHCSV